MSRRSAAEDLARSLPTTPFVAGRWQPASTRHSLEVVDPVTESPLVSVTEADATTVDRAVAAARDALDGGEWGRLDGAARGQLLLAFAQLIENRVEDFADLESLDAGKPGIEGRVIDLPQTVATFRHYAGWADKLTGQSIPTPGYQGRRTLSYTVRQPIGVVAAITPWNSPTMIGSWKRQAMEGMASLFDNGDQASKAASEAEIEKLHAKIGQLLVERDFLAKASGR